jgi:hypothetical protein
MGLNSGWRPPGRAHSFRPCERKMEWNLSRMGAGTIQANGHCSWVFVREGDTWKIRRDTWNITPGTGPRWCLKRPPRVTNSILMPRGDRLQPPRWLSYPSEVFAIFRVSSGNGPPIAPRPGASDRIAAFLRESLWLLVARLYRIPSMLLVAPPGPICGLYEGPTEPESVEQPGRSTKDATNSNIRTTGSFFCNMPFVRNMTDEWLYWSRQ